MLNDLFPIQPHTLKKIYLNQIISYDKVEEEIENRLLKLTGILYSLFKNEDNIKILRFRFIFKLEENDLEFSKLFKMSKENIEEDLLHIYENIMNLRKDYDYIEKIPYKNIYLKVYYIDLEALTKIENKNPFKKKLKRFKLRLDNNIQSVTYSNSIPSLKKLQIPEAFFHLENLLQEHLDKLEWRFTLLPTNWKTPWYNKNNRDYKEMKGEISDIKMEYRIKRSYLYNNN